MLEPSNCNSKLEKRPFSGTFCRHFLFSLREMVSFRFSFLSASFRSLAFYSRREIVLCSAFATSLLAQRSCHPQSTITNMAALDTGYLNAESAYALDQELMSTPGFTLDQLMELAGLSVAQAVHEVMKNNQKQPIIFVCGPGNNGGDGLVAARHLTLFGYDCTVVYPKRSSREPHYANLVKQLEDFNIEVRDDLVLPQSEKVTLVDAIFGFSFKGQPREPFSTMLKDMIVAQEAGMVTIVSVDVPSGWNVDEGDVSGIGLVPDVLISLTAPKLSAKTFEGRHFVGGRFLPPALAKKYNIRMPDYPGTAQAVEVATTRRWEEEYFEYLAEKEAKENSNSGKGKLSTGGEEWQEQYAEYLAGKGEQERTKDR